MRERHSAAGSDDGSPPSTASCRGSARRRFAPAVRRRLSIAWLPAMAVLLLVPGASAEAQPQDPPHGDWWVMHQDTPMDDLHFYLAITFAQKSPNPKAVESLNVICSGQESLMEFVEIDLDFFDEASVFVAAGDRHDFRVRWDDEPPSSLPFVVGSDADNLLFPLDQIDLNDAFITKLLAHERLLVEVRLLMSTEIFEFSLNGAADAIAEMRGLCLG